MADNTCGLTDFGCQVGWIQDEIKAFFVWVSEQIFNAIIAVFNAIPVPDWAASGADIFSGVPSNVGYFVGPFDLPSGAAIIVGAYGIRFLIRRIPFIG